MIYFLYSARIYDISTLGAAMSVTSITVDQFTPVGGNSNQLYVLHGII